MLPAAAWKSWRPRKPSYETAIASFPDSTQAPSTRSPQLTFTPLPTLDPSDVSRLLTPANFGIAPSPVSTAVPPSVTPIPTATEPPPTRTPMPTATESLPTRTPVPTATQPLPTLTPAETSCYRHQQAWITGAMNVREQPGINARKVGSAGTGESFPVLESRQGDTYCWLRISRGWMAQTAFVSATKPQQPVPSSAGSGVRQALANLNTLVVAPGHRCSPYDSDSYTLFAVCGSANCGETGRAHLRSLHRHHLQRRPRHGHRTYCGEI